MRTKTPKIIVGLGCYVAVTLILKGCSPLAASLEKGTRSTPTLPNLSSMTIRVVNYRTELANDAVTIPLNRAPGIHKLRLPPEAVDEFKLEGGTQFSMDGATVPREMVGVFHVSLSDQELESLEDFETRVEPADATNGLNTGTWNIFAAHTAELGATKKVLANLTGVELVYSAADGELSPAPEASPSPSPSP